MYNVENFMSFDIDFKKMILHDISIPISFLDKFDLVLEKLNTEELEYLYYRYQYELKIKDIADLFKVPDNKASLFLKKVLQKFGKEYKEILNDYIKGNGNDIEKRKTVVYFNILSVFDETKKVFSSEADIIIDTLSKKGFLFMYFNYNGLDKDSQSKISDFLGKRAIKMIYDFDVMNPPDFIIDIDKGNFMLLDFPNLVLPKYDFGTKNKNWSNYFNLV